MTEPQAMMDGPLVHKLRAEDATSVTLVTVPPFGYNVNSEVWHVPTRVVAAIEAQARDAALAEAEAVVAVARQARDLLAYFLWDEDDADDENDVIAAYDLLKEAVGPSTPESVSAALRAYEDADKVAALADVAGEVER